MPPEEVRIRELRAEPYADGRRVRVYLELTAFQQRPDAELRITSGSGTDVAGASVIETIDPKMELTLHLRGEVPAGEYHLHAIVLYRENEETEKSNGEEPDLTKQTVSVVDQSKISFEIP